MPRKTKMNDLTSHELVSEINPENLRLKNDFLSYLKSVQRSPGTINGYENDLDIFFVYCAKNLGNKKFVDITKRDLVSFQNWLINENGNSPSRVRRIKSAISSLSNYIVNILDDEAEFKDFRSIVRKIESPVNQPVREKSVFSDEQLEKLLDVLTKKEHYDKALNSTTLNSWAITFSNILGMDFYWHAMRHYFTTHLARSGLPDGVIQEIIGWSSADMVRIYKDLTTEEQLEQYFDSDGIKVVQPTKLSDL